MFIRASGAVALLVVAGCAASGPVRAARRDARRAEMEWSRERTGEMALAAAELRSRAVRSIAEGGHSWTKFGAAQDAPLLAALLEKMELIELNLANADTPGYKRISAQVDTSVGPVIGTESGGVRPYECKPRLKRVRQFEQGAALPGSNLDVMVRGDGFFMLEMPNGGLGYTRVGRVLRDSRGELIVALGAEYRLCNSPTVSDLVSTPDISIGVDGTIIVPDGTGVPQVIGNLQLARFPAPGELLTVDSNLFVATHAAGEPIIGQPGTQGLGLLVSGALERSNVEVLMELAELRRTRDQVDALIEAGRLTSSHAQP